MLLVTSGASSSENMLADKVVIRVCDKSFNNSW